jgi:hypothetical protein
MLNDNLPVPIELVQGVLPVDSRHAYTCYKQLVNKRYINVVLSLLE